MTYLQILNTIKDIALAQPNVNSVVREFLDLNREDAKYSAVVIQDRDGSRDRIVEQDYVTYTWHLGYVDRLTYDESNRDDIISTGINIINNIVNTIRNTWFPELEVSIIDRINTFDQRFTAQCAGVYVVLAVNTQVSDCIDSESTDLYDTYDAKITANGVYHFVPSGRPVDEINITVDVPGPKEEVVLNEKIVTNGLHTYTPLEDTVYGSVEINVDVQQSVSGYTVRDVLEVGLNMVNLYDSSTTMLRNYAMAGDNKLQTVDLPACTSVGYSAFQDCYSLQTVDLPACTSVGYSAFQDCYSLQTVSLPVCSYVGEKAFMYCRSLETVDLPACTSFGQYAFSACHSLTSISLPVCSSIPYEAFWNCYSLPSISLPVCNYISDYAFENCSKLKYVYVGGEISDVCTLNNTNAFNGCSRLKYIVVPVSLVESYKTATNWTYYSDKIVSSIPESPYSLCSFSDGILTGDIPYIDTELYDELNINNTDIISVSLPLCSTVKNATFYNCYNLQSIYLPECVSLGVSAFAECIRLQTISLPKCEYIGDRCFQGAFQSNTTGYDININLPVCSYIGSSAFYWTQRSLTLTLGYDGVVDLPSGSHTFNVTTVRSIYVPASLVDAYKSATNWSYYSNRIFPISE